MTKGCGGSAPAFGSHCDCGLGPFCAFVPHISLQPVQMSFRITKGAAPITAPVDRWFLAPCQLRSPAELHPLLGRDWAALQSQQGAARRSDLAYIPSVEDCTAPPTAHISASNFTTEVRSARRTRTAARMRRRACVRLVPCTPVLGAWASSASPSIVDAPLRPLRRIRCSEVRRSFSLLFVYGTTACIETRRSPAKDPACYAACTKRCMRCPQTGR